MYGGALGSLMIVKISSFVNILKSDIYIKGAGGFGVIGSKAKPLRRGEKLLSIVLSTMWYNINNKY